LCGDQLPNPAFSPNANFGGIDLELLVLCLFRVRAHGFSDVADLLHLIDGFGLSERTTCRVVSD
jgi:hypothetical protein